MLEKDQEKKDEETNTSAWSAEKQAAWTAYITRKEKEGKAAWPEERWSKNFDQLELARKKKKELEAKQKAEAERKQKELEAKQKAEAERKQKELEANPTPTFHVDYAKIFCAYLNLS